MSEFWKSTPKFWCKYCSIYVKDTPLEKNNHEGSPRHQGNLKRSLKELHKTNERAERDKQYAKAEAARLNGTATGAAAGIVDGGDGKFKTSVNFTKTAGRAASADDRKRQMAELAALGVAVPEDFRRDNAMVGDWQTTSQKVIWDKSASVKEEQDGDTKPNLATGLRKRKAEEKPEEDEEEAPVKLEEGSRRPRYGRDLKSLPGDEDNDLDALLGSTGNLVKKQKIEAKEGFKQEEVKASPDQHTADSVDVPQQSVIKTEEIGESLEGKAPITDVIAEEPPSADVGSIFKKRKKPIRPK